MRLNPSAVFSALACGLVAGAFAQTGLTPPVPPAPETPAVASYSPPPSEPAAAPGIKAPRNALFRTVLMNNAAAENTVADYMVRPNRIGSLQYIAGATGGAEAGNPINSGAFSFKGGSLNWFGSVLGGADPDDIRLGLGNDNFGAGLLVSTAQTYTNPVLGDRGYSALETDGGALFGSLGMGAASSLYGELGLFTGFDNLLDNADPTLRNASLDLSNTNLFLRVMAGWKKEAAGEGTGAMNGELTVNVSQKQNQIAPTDTIVIFEIAAFFNHGSVLRQNASYTVLAGVNWQGLFHTEDWNAAVAGGAARPTRKHGRFSISPNVDFQKTLAKGFEAFTGAGVTLAADAFQNMPAVLGNPEGNWSVVTTAADVAVGLRWNYENFAIEGSVNDALLINGPYFLGGVPTGLFGQFGLSLGF